jgi:hypothetical protein
VQVLKQHYVVKDESEVYFLVLPRLIDVMLTSHYTMTQTRGRFNFVKAASRENVRLSFLVLSGLTLHERHWLID